MNGGLEDIFISKLQPFTLFARQKCHKALSGAEYSASGGQELGNIPFRGIEGRDEPRFRYRLRPDAEAALLLQSCDVLARQCHEDFVGFHYLSQIAPGHIRETIAKKRGHAVRV